jgi:chemotaxis protein methyltransferase CheR
MQIITNRQDNQKSIYIDGKVFDKSHESWLLDELNDSASSYLITIIDISSIPYSIVKRLIEINSISKVYITNKSLWLYFKKIGIECQHKSSLEYTKEIKVIALNGSAGSFNQIIEIIKNLPLADITIFITIHIGENQNSIAQILQSYTKYVVIDAKDGIFVQTKHIYVAPANMHMSVSKGTIYTSKSEKVNYARPSIAVSIESLSKEYRNTLLNIMLSGYGHDGAEVLVQLKNNNSETILIDPNECEAKELIENSKETNNYDRVLGLHDIMEYLKDNLISIDIDDTSLNDFLQKVYDRYGYDFRDYDRKSIVRRVEINMKRVGTHSVNNFFISILQNQELFNSLFSDISINVTSFFRNPETFKIIKDELLPYIDTFSHIKIWSAGCSSGEEVYSLAIMLDELGMLKKSQIYATDFNSAILQEAKNGIYPKRYLKMFENNYIYAGGESNFNNYFEIYDHQIVIKEYLKKRVLFFNHNLATDSEMNEFQLILCRNTLIYFNKELKQRVIKLFDNSLERNCFLVLGETESIQDISQTCLFNYNKKHKIYKKGLV